MGGGSMGGGSTTGGATGGGSGTGGLGEGEAAANTFGGSGLGSGAGGAGSSTWACSIVKSIETDEVLVASLGLEKSTSTNKRITTDSTAKAITNVEATRFLLVTITSDVNFMRSLPLLGSFIVGSQ
jgi:hypothetical protein